ncbi:MAG: sensor domain-containing diguanylate cyclase [Acidobacteriota bacterium]|nr:sensor domain-containing diguanylate cyclase [Acidobacteriota bacterium]
MDSAHANPEDTASEPAHDEAHPGARYARELLNGEWESEFDELAQLAATICGTPISAITLLDGCLYRFKAAVGLDLPDTACEFAFCDYAIRRPGLFLVENALEDPRFATNPLVVDEPRIRFYAGMPLETPDGFALGTLCVIDRRPRRLTEQQRDAMRVLARQVMGRVELRIQQKAAAEAIAEKDRLTAWLAEYQRQLEDANDRLRSLATTDVLTGLRNRRVFEERLTFEFSMARRKQRDLAVVVLDADNFKNVNDELGHAAGDAVLQMLARVMMERARTTDVPVRLGGEEFAVILPDTDEHGALGWSRRMQEALAAAPWTGRAVTVSIGVAGLMPWCADPAQLVARADEALYRAKANGKNCAVGAHELSMQSIA